MVVPLCRGHHPNPLGVPRHKGGNLFWEEETQASRSPVQDSSLPSRRRGAAWQVYSPFARTATPMSAENFRA